ncbi:MAG: SUMF1/EgtB/PvdO family nonheme iron enzyme [candidate division Zixibacteria bacterium]|nr:SUMF1/EgtB/PvdO family nonheme iron enzyme [candidate division Zixibacteria bacterium]
MRKSSISLIVLVSYILLLYLPSFCQTTIAVLELEAKGVTIIEASALSDRLRAELFKTGKFRVVEREEMDKILTEQGFQMTGACTSTECVVQAGQLLGVKQMVAGSVSKVGNTYSVYSRLVNVETGELVEVATYDSQDKIDNLLISGLSIIAAKLTDSKLKLNSSDSIKSELNYSGSLLANRISNNMIYVKGGRFYMGCDERPCNDNEKPVHQVVMKGFYIGKYEVTQKEWKDVLGENPSEQIGDSLPITNITWLDAVDYCNRKSSIEGLELCYKTYNNKVLCDFKSNGYRLPTEAEWEYSARGGAKSQGYKYSGSDNADEVAWYGENSYKQLKPIGTKMGNELGIFDMSGNALEWCWDWMTEYSKATEINPQGPHKGVNKVLRSPRWGKPSNISVRVSNRAGRHPNDAGKYIGLRLCRSEVE